MKSESLLQAFSDLEDRYVRSAAAFLRQKEEPVKLNKRKKILRAALIAAILAVLTLGSAYALGLFSMEVRPPKEGEELTGHSVTYNPWTLEEVQEEQDLTKSPLILQFTGEGEIRKVRFRPNWLPEEQEGWTFERYGDEGIEDWFYYYTCFFDRSQGGRGVLYQIECHYARPDTTIYMGGRSAVVTREEDWDKLHITEIEQEDLFPAKDGSSPVFRYVLVFDPSAGWLVSIGGTADFETLEHIAREMEFETLDEPPEPSGGDYSYLGVGVG